MRDTWFQLINVVVSLICKCYDKQGDFSFKYDICYSLYMFLTINKSIQEKYILHNHMSKNTVHRPNGNVFLWHMFYIGKLLSCRQQPNNTAINTFLGTYLYRKKCFVKKYRLLLIYGDVTPFLHSPQIVFSKQLIF